MRAIYVIADHPFVSPTLLDATIQAVDLARELLEAGDRAEALKLYDEALKTRRGLEASMRPDAIATSSSRSLPSGLRARDGWRRHAVGGY